METQESEKIDLTNDDISPSTSQADNKQIRYKQTGISKYTCTNQEKIAIDNALTKFIALEAQPYSLVEKTHFIKLVKALNASYALPSRKTMSTNLIPALYNKTREAVSEILHKNRFYSFTTDCWTSAARQPYLAVTVHFLTDSFKMQSACLGCYEMSEDHTAENISDALSCSLNEWNITEDNQRIAFTTDYGANVVLAVKNISQNHIPCFGHTLNTAINNAFQIKELESCIQKIKKIQSICAFSWKITRELGKCQKKLNLPQRKVPSFTKTRWWSLLNLMVIVSEQHYALRDLFQNFNKGTYRNFILENVEVDVINETIGVLKPLKAISENLSAEKCVTASCIIPLYEKLKQGFRESVDETQANTDIIHTKNIIMQTILNKLNERYRTNIHTYNVLSLSTFLDPRFKQKYFKENEITSIKQLIIPDMESIEPSNQEPNQQVAKKPKTGLAAVFLSDVESEVEIDKTPENEIDNYLKGLPIAMNEDPLHWWYSNQNFYPRLSKLAQRYLSVQATSVPSERVFSRGGSIVSDNRTALTGEHVEQLIFLTMNSMFID